MANTLVRHGAIRAACVFLIPSSDQQTQPNPFSQREGRAKGASTDNLISSKLPSPIVPMLLAEPYEAVGIWVRHQSPPPQKVTTTMPLQPLMPAELVFTLSDTAKWLGLSISELECLYSSGRGPDFEEIWPDICSSAEEIKTWAMENVHAPTPWFERFDVLDPDDATPSRIERLDGYFVLSAKEEARMLRLLAKTCSHDAPDPGVCRIYRADSPAFSCGFDASTVRRGLAPMVDVEGASPMVTAVEEP